MRPLGRLMRGGRLWVLVSVLLPAVLFAVAAYFDYRSEVARAQLRVNITTRALSEHAQASLQSVDLVIARVVDRIGGRDPADLRADRGFHDFLVAIQQSLPQAESVFVVDGDGVLTASSRTFPAPVFDAREREYFTGSRENRRLFVSAPFRGQVAQTFAFTLSRAIERNGAFEGIVAVTVYPQYFSGFYRAVLDRPNASTTALVRATDGAVLLRYPESDLIPPRLQPTSPLLRAASGGADSGFYLARSTIDGTVRYAGFARLQGLPLIVNFNLDESVVLEAWHSHLLVFAAFALLAAAALIATARLALTGAARERRSLELLLNETRRRHDAEAQLHQAQKMEALGRLTGGVAHDFNNLLAAILAGVELTKKRITDPQAVRLLDMSKDAAERGAKLTKQMLAFSRKQEVLPRPLDPNAVIREAEDLITRTAGGLVRVRLDLADGVWPIMADPVQLEVALLNLVANARDAMPDGGELSISTANGPSAGDRAANMPPGDVVSIVVADTGTGMSDEVKARAFEPFFTTKGPSKGTGLGLSQVFGFVAQLGGTAAIDSAPGKGTSIALRLPRSAAPARAKSDSVAAPSADTPRECVRVLVVDDEDIVREVIGAMVAELGHQSATAASGDEALKRLAAEPFDLVLADHAMPGMTGLELGAEAERRHPRLAIVFMSGYAEAVSAEQWTATGRIVLRKPFLAGELDAAIRQALSRRPGSAPRAA